MKKTVLDFKFKKQVNNNFNESIKNFFMDFKENGCIENEKLFIKIYKDMDCLYYMEQFNEYEDTYLNMQKEWFLLESLKRCLIDFKDDRFINKENKYSFEFLSKALSINMEFVNIYLDNIMKNKKTFYESLIEYGFMKENERMSSYRKIEDLLSFINLLEIIINKDNEFKMNVEKYYMNNSMSSIYYRKENDESKIFFYFLQVKRNSKKPYNYEDMKLLILKNKKILESIGVNIEDVIFNGGEENLYSDLNCLRSMLKINFKSNEYEDKFNILKKIIVNNLSEDEIELIEEIFNEKEVLFEKHSIENKLSISIKNNKKIKRI